MSIMTDPKEVLAEYFFQRQIQLNPSFCSLPESGNSTHENTLKDFARLLINNAEWKMTEFSALYSSAWSKGSNSLDEVRTQSFYAESYSRQCFKNKLSLKEDAPVSDLTSPIPAGGHRQALRACHMDLLNMNLPSSYLLDELVANHLMEESDARSILAKEEKSITETFLRRLPVMFTLQNFVDKFIPIFSKYFPDEASMLWAVMQQISTVPDLSRCYNCQVKGLVEPRLLAHAMYSNGIIQPNMYQDLRGQAISNQEKWDSLVTKVKDHRYILETIKNRFPSVYDEFDLANAESIDCWCHKIILQSALPSGDCKSGGSGFDIANMDDFKSYEGSLGDTEGGSFYTSETDDIRTSDVMMYPVGRRNSLSDMSATSNKGFDQENQHLTGEQTPKSQQTKGVLEHCETKGAKELRKSASESKTDIKSENAKPSVNNNASKRSLVVSVKIFINRHFRHKIDVPIAPKLDEYAYDAFVSFADKDMNFVIEDTHVNLEEKMGMKLCIYQRDFLAGTAKASNIVAAVRRSRKTLVVMSPATVQSWWCEFQINMANMESIHGDRRVLIFLMYEFVAADLMPAYLVPLLRRGPYLDYATTEGDDSFWHELAKVIRE